MASRMPACRMLAAALQRRGQLERAQAAVDQEEQEKLEKKMGIDNLYTPDNIEVVHAVVKALQAQ